MLLSYWKVVNFMYSLLTFPIPVNKPIGPADPVRPLCPRSPFSPVGPGSPSLH